MANFILPYEPQYVGHRLAEERHAQTKRWLHERELSQSSPSIVPDHPLEDDKQPLKERVALRH